MPENVEEALVIDSDLRTISVPANFYLGVYNDKDVHSVLFTMPRYYDGNDFSDFNIRVNFINAAGIGGVYDVEDPDIGEEEIEFEWLLGRNVFTAPGTVQFIVCLRINGIDGAIVKEYNTTIATAKVLPGLEVDQNADDEAYSILDHMIYLESLASTFAESAASTMDTITMAERKVTAMITPPVVVTEASEMLDEEVIYIYNGSEEGYEEGHWYYWSGLRWTDGGVYAIQGPATDTTLSTSGAPADAKSTGDAISDLNTRLQSLEALKLLIWG